MVVNEAQIPGTKIELYSTLLDTLLLSMSSILKALEYHPNSVGYLSQFFQHAGRTLPSILVMPSKTWVFYLSDEIFALDKPILVTIDAQSTTILTIQLAADRSAETWKA